MACGFAQWPITVPVKEWVRAFQYLVVFLLVNIDRGNPHKRSPLGPSMTFKCVKVPRGPKSEAGWCRIYSNYPAGQQLPLQGRARNGAPGGDLQAPQFSSRRSDLVIRKRQRKTPFTSQTGKSRKLADALCGDRGLLSCAGGHQCPPAPLFLRCVLRTLLWVYLGSWGQGEPEVGATGEPHGK